MSHLNQQVRIVPQTPRLAAVVEGVNAKEPLTREVFSVIKNALLDYKVLFFRDQHLTPDEQRVFGEHFGAPFIHPLRDEDEGFTDITVVPIFHSDGGYLPYGSSFSVLQMLEIPDVGGDTIWADLVSAYDALSEPFRAFLDPLVAVNSKLGGVQGSSPEALLRTYRQDHAVDADELTPEQIAEVNAQYSTTELPLVRVIPENGARCCYVSKLHTRSIKGLSAEESDGILDILFRQQLHPRFTFRWRWSPGDLAVWDQRTTLHSGVEDYGDARRFAQRMSVAPERPISIDEYARTRTHAFSG